MNCENSDRLQKALDDNLEDDIIKEHKYNLSHSKLYKREVEKARLVVFNNLIKQQVYEAAEEIILSLVSRILFTDATTVAIMDNVNIISGQVDVINTALSFIANDYNRFKTWITAISRTMRYVITRVYDLNSLESNG